MTAAERRRAWLLAAAIGALHVAGFGILLGLVARRHLPGFPVGIGITAYTLGLRHAFDADHIAAIDNTTRKLMGTGRRPLAVGFWFSLGHSSVVFALSLLLACGVRALAGDVSDDGSALHVVTGRDRHDCVGDVPAGHRPRQPDDAVRRHPRRRVHALGRPEAEVERLLAPRGPISR